MKCSKAEIASEASANMRARRAERGPAVHSFSPQANLGSLRSPIFSQALGRLASVAISALENFTGEPVRRLDPDLIRIRDLLVYGTKERVNRYSPV